MNFKNSLVLVLSFFFFLIIVSAEEDCCQTNYDNNSEYSFSESVSCPYDEQMRLREIVGRTSFSYEFVKYSESLGFDVYLQGITIDFYAVVRDTPAVFEYQDGKNFALRVGFVSGETHLVDFYASNRTLCPDFKIITKYIQIPHYNSYSEHPLCEGHEQYVLCQRFSDIHRMIRDEIEFVNKMQIYISSLEVNDEYIPEEPERFGGIIAIIINFFTKYYFIILTVATTLLIGGVIYVITKRRSRIL